MMRKYKCPKCSMICKTSYCAECDCSIPYSNSFDDDAAEPTLSKREEKRQDNRCDKCGSLITNPSAASCPVCGYYFTKRVKTYTGADEGRTATSSYDPDVRIGSVFYVDTVNKLFKVGNSPTIYQFAAMINYDVHEDGGITQKGGIGRAVVGGALFGGIGAIVGANTRKSKDMATSLYITISLNHTNRIEKIVFINSPIAKEGTTYRMMRSLADDVASELDYIASINNSQTPPTAESNGSSAADELLKYKQLLDMGAINQDEFDAKKKQLLGL